MEAKGFLVATGNTAKIFTALAFKYFAEVKVDIAVVEV
jgi:folylpolyglutamate synthase/dihydropteroate synthase